MEPALKSRLIGAAVLVAIAVIVVPMFFPGTPPGADNSKSMSLDIPSAPSSQMRSETLAVGSQSSGSSASQAVSSDHLATVDIPSRKPAAVEPDATSSDATARSQASESDQAQQPRQAASAASQAAPEPSSEPAAHPAPKDSTAPGAAAKERYSLNLGAYGKRANAQKLMQRVAKLGYPVNVDATRISGNPAARVIAGPFDSRAAAEAARLKIKGAVHGVPAKLESSAADQHGNAPASAVPAHRAGAWAVQLGAFSHKSDAAKLRDRARAAGFDSYLDDVKSGGKTLWRVRVGPQTQRSDAVKTQAALKSKLKMSGVVVSTS